MQPTPTPPRISHIIRGALFGVCSLLATFVIGFPLGMFFPYLVYLALYHADRLLPFTTHYYQSLLSNGFIFLFSGFIAIVGIWAGISTYRAQRRQWQAYKEQALSEKADTLGGDSVNLPPPTALPLLNAVIEDRLSLLLFLTTEVVWAWAMVLAYMAWEQLLFRWPPNRNLEHCIIGSVVALFLVISIITFMVMQPRRIVVDHLGITTHQRNRERTIMWSDVRALDFTPFESYHITTTTKPLHLLALSGNSAEAQQKRQAIREAIALAMHETRLPLVGDREALQQRDTALDIQKSKRQQVTRNIAYLLCALFCLSFASILIVATYPNATYHTVSGQLAHYTRESKEVAIQISGSATTFTMTTNGVSPYPPPTLPSGIPLSMQVNGTDVGTLDINTATIQWHIVTQAYTEPWSRWLEIIVIGGLFLLPGVGFLIAGLVGLWPQASPGDLTTALDIFPPRGLMSLAADGTLSSSISTIDRN